MALNSLPAWIDKISSPAQLGGIETAVLDNGLGRGMRVAWVNTGSGLRYKIVLDRAMDIGEAFYNQFGLTWINHGGMIGPLPLADKGLDWLRAFGGGLLTTCGLSHVGGPESDEFGHRGLHGRISNIPAELITVMQPDPVAGKLEMSITGRMREQTIFGPSLELTRTLSSRLGSPTILIEDSVFNAGNRPAPHMILYHCNFGWPLVDEGTEILWQGEWKPRHEPDRHVIFREGNNFKKCPAPLDTHGGAGEEVAFIDLRQDERGYCRCGLYNEKIGIALSLRFLKKQLPWLTNWQHWGKGEYVTGLEPGTHPPIGQSQARTQQTLINLEPGEVRKYSLEIEVLQGMDKIQEWLAPLL